MKIFLFILLGLQLTFTPLISFSKQPHYYGRSYLGTEYRNKEIPKCNQYNKNSICADYIEIKNCKDMNNYMQSFGFKMDYCKNEK